MQSNLIIHYILFFNYKFLHPYSSTTAITCCCCYYFTSLIFEQKKKCFTNKNCVKLKIQVHTPKKNHTIYTRIYNTKSQIIVWQKKIQLIPFIVCTIFCVYISISMPMPIKNNNLFIHCFSYTATYSNFLFYGRLYK